MIFVGSLKYSPVYKSHCCAFGKACEDMGYQVKYLFSHAYEWMLPQPVKKKTIFIGNSTSISSMVKDALNPKTVRLINKVFSEDKPTHVYIHNYHLLDHAIAKACRENGGKFIYHSHEPYVENKSSHGGLQQYWLYLNEYMEARLLRSTDIAIVSSNEGSRLFDVAYPWFKGKKLQIPLMYEDIGYSDSPPSRERRYITFVGPPVPAKGPEIFLKILEYTAYYCPDLSFLMISRHNIKDKRFLSARNLTIFSKKQISDEEFGEIMRHSIAVLTPYTRETQSSVVLVAYMHGAPVISSNSGGLPEFVRCGETGCLVDVNAPVEDWVEAINSVSQNHQYMEKKCRRFFIEEFSELNWPKYFRELDLD